MIILIVILSLVAALIILMLVRAALFTPKAQSFPAPEKVEFDGEKAVSALQTLIRYKTISYVDPAKEDDAEFENFTSALPALFPNVYANSAPIRLPGRALLYKIAGKSDKKPTVLMAHYDVVPVNEEEWDKPAFDGIIEDGVMWGRGTIDTKVTFSGILFASDTLLAKGFIPENDVYLAFSGGEEVSGPGANHIIDWFIDHNVEPALVLDEGGGVVSNVFPGVKAPCAMIGTAEKGMMNASFTVKSAGGHASSPKPHTPVGILSKACVKVENHPFPMHMTRPVKEMLDTLGRNAPFALRIVFANLWLFQGLLDFAMKKVGGEINALLRTTVAFTQAEGSQAPNVIPPIAKMTANLRLNPEDTSAKAKKRLEKVIGEPSVTVDIWNVTEPSPISETNCEPWNRVACAVSETWDGCLVSPYLMMACSDSRHYSRLSNHVYRFSAMALSKEERASIHGNNEKLPVETVKRAAEFFIRFMKKC
ncbi:MAG: M20/M25/M40 family metallo-hydrolase [Clostridia bacterium]|nr:M20/M25/M40 family metallo-hydrolase [Clostridia bacterium]